MSTEYYRSDDPIENFVLKVVVQEIIGASQDSSSAPAKIIKQTINWQQKLYSPSEIVDYIHHQHSAYGTAIQKEIRGSIGRLEREGRDMRGLLTEDAMLFTLTDRDVKQRESQEFSLFADPDSTHRNVSSLHSLTRDRNQELFSQQEFLGDEEGRKRKHTLRSKCMKICLATEILVKELLHDRARDADYDDYFTCHELCSITLFENGVFEVSPGLSQPVSDALLALGAGSSVEALQRTTSTAAASLTVFLDDASAEHAIKRGLALSARRLRTLQGREFVYSVYNSREVWSSVRLEAMQREKGVHEAVRASEHRPYLPLKPATSFPHLQHHLFLLELRSAEGFQCSQLMTAYDIALPPKWTLLSPSSSSSDTSLQGMTHLACRSTADTSSVARLLLALFVLLLSCASVTLGFNGDRGSSALYLAPCLLLLVLGFVRIRSHRDLHSDNFDDTLVLNHTLQLRCASPADTGDTAHAQETLTISLQVFSQGAFGRSLLEGEALLSIPARALTKDDGEYEAQVLELQGGVHSQMQALFLGQRPALKTEHSASFLGLPAVDPDKRSTARLGSRSRIAGTIRIRMQRIVMHAPGILQQEQKQIKGGLSDPKPSARVELQRLRASFSSNRTASSSTPTSAADGQPSARPSVRSILDALGSGSSNLNHARPLDKQHQQQHQPSEDVSSRIGTDTVSRPKGMGS